MKTTINNPKDENQELKEILTLKYGTMTDVDKLVDYIDVIVCEMFMTKKVSEPYHCHKLMNLLNDKLNELS